MFIRKATEVPIEMIKVNRQQPRQSFGEQQLRELRDSIKEYGVLQPLILRKEAGGGFLLIAGERRLRAAAMAGLDKVPAIIKEATEEEIGLIALVENIQRENLGYIEEAKAYQQLMEKYGINQSSLALKLGKNQSTISNKIRLLSLPDDIQQLLISNKLTERHARSLLKVEGDGERRLIVDKVIKHGFNVRQTEKLVEEYLEGRAIKDKEKNKIRHISYKLYLNTLRKAFTDMDLHEKGATFEQRDEGDNLKITIIIPKGQELPADVS
ncbi:MAG: ParB/RepB/Spo0J family partition protein [Bacillota bacterium]|nr:ParB/RepB/Spo0J family partition protein [Bacillota bacterium]